MPHHYLETALFAAIAEGNKENVKRLIEAIDTSSRTNHFNKASLAARNDNELTYLHFALECGACDCFEILFPYYTDESELLLSPDNMGRTLFWWAIARSKKPIAEKLLSYYQKKTENSETTSASLADDMWLQADKNKETPLHLTALNGDDTLLPWLLGLMNKGGNIINLVNDANNDGNTPLHLACLYNRPKQIILLLQQGASVSLQNNAKKSSLNYLKENPFILAWQKLDKNEKRKILEQINWQYLASPDDETLKSFLAKLSAQTSLLDTVKHALTHQFQIESKLGIILSVLEQGKNPYAEAAYHQLGQERLKLKYYSKKIDECVKKIEELSSPMDRALHVIIGGYISITSAMMLSFCELMLLAHMVVDEISFSSILLLLTTGTYSPFLIALAMGVFLLAGLITIGIGLYKSYKAFQAYNLALEEIKSFFPEIKKIQEALSLIEKNRSNDLPITTSALQKLTSMVNSLNDINNHNHAMNFLGSINNHNHADTITQLTDLKNLLTDISEALRKNNKPIGLETEIKQTADILINITSNREQILPQITTLKNNDEADGLLANAPKISQSPLLPVTQPASNNDNSNEEIIPLLDRTQFGLRS